MSHPNLDKSITDAIDLQNKQGGVMADELEIGTKLVLETDNSVYELIKTGEKDFQISGGWFATKGKNGVVVQIIGSNWGGSMLKVNWIGKFMRLELSTPTLEKPTLTTSFVRSMKIELPSGKTFEVWD